MDNKYTVQWNGRKNESRTTHKREERTALREGEENLVKLMRQKYDKKVKRSASADLMGYTEKQANDTEKDDFKTCRLSIE